MSYKSDCTQIIIYLEGYSGAILAQGDDITLSATFQPDTAYIGQNADLLIVATFTPMGGNQQMMFMRDETGAWQNGDANL